MVNQKDIEKLMDLKKQLKDELSEAMIENNSAEEKRLSKKLEGVENYIKTNLNKWGKSRDFSNPSERMRISIFRAIKTAKNNIKEVHEELFFHIDEYLETGTYNFYKPDKSTSWVA